MKKLSHSLSQHIRPIAAIAMLALCCAAGAAGVDTIVVATWNAENLFDAEANQQNGGDEEFTPGSWRRWTPERYNQKLDRLAWVISRMDPDILCMNEIENEKVAHDLMDRVNKKFGKDLKHLAHVESPDPRGIDNILISRYPVTSVKYVSKRTERGYLLVDVEVDGTKITFLVCHWKSQSGDYEENIVIRTRQALAVREGVLKILADDPNASVVIAGDFNEDLDDKSLVKALEAVPDRDMSVGTAGETVKFFNLLGDIPPEKRGSYYYARRKVWNTFDAIIVPPSMLAPISESGPAWRAPPAEKGLTKTFSLPQMRDGREGRPKAYRRVRIQNRPDNYYIEGYSDHFPIVTVLERAKTPAVASAKGSR